MILVPFIILNIKESINQEMIQRKRKICLFIVLKVIYFENPS